MHRPVALLTLFALVACQSYQFTPVGRCLLQPGQVSIATTSTVDILFVVDDSLSMDDYQANLANNFGVFIERLAQKQRERIQAGKDPFDFYIAVTTTSVMVNRYLAANGGCGRVNANTCSIDSTTSPPARAPYSYACTTAGEPCGDMVSNYYNYLKDGKCKPGILKANGDLYPAGDFVTLGSNPKVLAFTKDLNWANPSADPAIERLIQAFKENVKVGSCGANQEMPFEAAKLAISKAIARRDGLWPHDNSKLAVIFVGNEDDCSSVRADAGGIVWENSDTGQDSCYVDAQRATPEKLTPLAAYSDYLTGLGRPLVAAFVRPGFTDCNGVGGPGTRMQRLGSALSSAGAITLEASVCGAFAGVLERIADELEPPDWLMLPTMPAAASVTQLRVQEPSGETVHLCEGPDPTKEWWFVDCTTSQSLPAGQVDACIRLADNSACEPEPGQVLRAQYVGRIPSSGCSSNQECASVLGGTASEWRCDGATSSQKGTCLCAGHQ